MRFQRYQAFWWILISEMGLLGVVWAQGDKDTLDGCPAKINNGNYTNTTFTSRKDSYQEYSWDDTPIMKLLLRVADGIKRVQMNNPSNITFQVQVPNGVNTTELISTLGANSSNLDGTTFTMKGNAHTLWWLLKPLMQLMPQKVVHLRVPVWLCEQDCGGSYIPYPRADYWSRIVMWLAPLFLLLGNIHLPPLGRWNIYCVIIHALGDPVDFMASLNSRLDVGSTLYRLFKEREVHRQGEFQVSYFGAFDFHNQKGQALSPTIQGQDEICVSSSSTVVVDPTEDVHIHRPGNVPSYRPRDTPVTKSSIPPQPYVTMTEPTIMSLSSHMHRPQAHENEKPAGLAFGQGSTDDGSWTTTEDHTPCSDNNADDHCILEVTAQDLATICTAYDDLGHLFPYREMSNCLRTFLRSASIPQRLLVEKALMEAAIDLSEAWADEMFRAAVAVIGYVLAVAVAFLKTIDPWEHKPGPNNPAAVDLKKYDIPNQGNNMWMDRNQTYSESNPNFNNRTSHSIAFAISYSWVITAVILSAAAGGFSNHHATEKVLDRLNKKVPELNIPQWDTVTGKSLTRIGATGMNYAYRPVKSLSTTQNIKILKPTAKSKTRLEHHYLHRKSAVYMRTVVVILPLLVATTCAFLISWYTPTVGFGCRSLHQVCLLGLYFLSHGLTLLIQRVVVSPDIRAYQYTCIIIKDTIVSVIHLTFLFLAFYGWYNSCWCWSAWLSWRESAWVTLYFEEEILSKLKTLFPLLAFGGIAFQFAFVGILLWRKPKCRIFKRTEEEQLGDAKRLRRYERQLSGDCSICNR